MGSNKVRLLETVIETVTDWARGQTGVLALALVGSHARGAARPDSDIDLMLLAADPHSYSMLDRLASMKWSHAGLRVIRTADEVYGAAWSRRVWFEPPTEVEFTFAALSWATVDPIDPGTLRVISDGCQILYDPEGHLARLCAAVAVSSAMLPDAP